jgi:hypothetical protein
VSRSATPRPGRLLLAVTVVLTAACSARAGSVTPRAQDERSSLRALQAQLRGPFAQSPIFADGTARNVAIAVMRQRSAPAVPEVDIYQWRANRWQPQAGVTLDVGGSVATDGGAPTPIRTADLTPATAPELVVTVHYNAGPATAVLSDIGGHWHPLSFHGGVTQDGDERFDVSLGANGTVTSRENDCVPDCAEGHQVVTVYHFVAGTSRLEAYTNR